MINNNVNASCFLKLLVIKEKFPECCYTYVYGAMAELVDARGLKPRDHYDRVGSSPTGPTT